MRWRRKSAGAADVCYTGGSIGGKRTPEKGRGTCTKARSGEGNKGRHKHILREIRAHREHFWTEARHQLAENVEGELHPFKALESQKLGQRFTSSKTHPRKNAAAMSKPEKGVSYSPLHATVGPLGSRGRILLSPQCYQTIDLLRTAQCRQISSFCSYSHRCVVCETRARLLLLLLLLPNQHRNNRRWRVAS